MHILRIKGQRPLFGSVSVHGAKNSVLPIMGAVILAGGQCRIHNCPALSDVEAATKILRHLGCRVSRHGGIVAIDSAPMQETEIPDELMREMRSSVIFLGPILARSGQATLSMPGGCELGPRPIDPHLEAMRLMGAHVQETGGNIICQAPDGLHGARINLSIPSVGATENAMLAASRARGTAVITNAAREPEIEDLQAFLQKLGIPVSGAGSSTVVVEGVPEPMPCGTVRHQVIPDRIVAATYLSAVASAGGKVKIEGVYPRHFSTVTDALAEAGCAVNIGTDWVEIASSGNLHAIRPVVTRPYPGFPTDAQPPLMAASLKFQGTTVFLENIFENRFRHIDELRRMGADIKVEGKVALVCGVKQLTGASVQATDLRGGAALIVAALGAEGESSISGLEHIDRGYEHIASALAALGADIVRVDNSL